MHKQLYLRIPLPLVTQLSAVHLNSLTESQRNLWQQTLRALSGSAALDRLEICRLPRRRKSEGSAEIRDWTVGMCAADQAAATPADDPQVHAAAEAHSGPGELNALQRIRSWLQIAPLHVAELSDLVPPLKSSVPQSQRLLYRFGDKPSPTGDRLPPMRMRGDLDATSRLSAHLRFGEMGPRLLLWLVERCQRAMLRDRHRSNNPAVRKQVLVYRRRLLWRELAYWFLWYYPNYPDVSLRPQYESQRWTPSPHYGGRSCGGPQSPLGKWQRGATGFPLVDAAMRQLWAIGWCNNYLRHVVASFLVEHLNVSWREGMAWFHETLIDSDVAINCFMWQNGGRSGCDQWNFVMDPVNAQKSCDPLGNFVKYWIPELAAVPSNYVHCPWSMPMTMKASSFAASTKSNTEAYPPPMLTDVTLARRSALASVMEVRLGLGAKFVLDDGCEAVQLPDGRWVRLITRAEFRKCMPGQVHSAALCAIELTRQSAARSIDVQRDERFSHPLREALQIAVDNHRRAYGEESTEDEI